MTVDIPSVNTDVSSWTSVSVVTGHLIHACAVGLYVSGRTGGETKAGMRGRISIVVEKAGRAVPGSDTYGNGTAVGPVQTY